MATRTTECSRTGNWIKEKDKSTEGKERKKNRKKLTDKAW
jgi:hypothetical protein